jgi:hypothetical protein
MGFPLTNFLGRCPKLKAENARRFESQSLGHAVTVVKSPTALHRRIAPLAFLRKLFTDFTWAKPRAEGLTLRIFMRMCVYANHH